MDLELGEDGRMYAHVGGAWPDLKVHGNFYRDENAQPNKPEKPRARRYRGGPLRKERVRSTLGDVELSEEQEQAWDREKEAKQLAEEVRRLKEQQARLQEEVDAWEEAAAAIRAKGTPEGEAAREQEEREEAVAEELELKLEELHQARVAAKKLGGGRFQQVAAATLKQALAGAACKTVVAAAALRAVNEAVESRTTQHVEMSFDEARVFLNKCTEGMQPVHEPAAPGVPKTVRAAEVVSSPGWTSTKSGDVFGGEGVIDDERVNLDEFCFPEPEKLTDEKLEEHIKALLSKSKLETVRARERYVRIMKAHKDAFCTGLKDFKPGQVDAPQLKLEVTPGPPVRQPRRQLSPDNIEWLS